MSPYLPLYGYWLAAGILRDRPLPDRGGGPLEDLGGLGRYIISYIQAQQHFRICSNSRFFSVRNPAAASTRSPLEAGTIDDGPS